VAMQGVEGDNVRVLGGSFDEVAFGRFAIGGAVVANKDFPGRQRRVQVYRDKSRFADCGLWAPPSDTSRPRRARRRGGASSHCPWQNVEVSVAVTTKLHRDPAFNRVTILPHIWFDERQRL
jgi:hypothetical protein